jgi:hypothetical protein
MNARAVGPNTGRRHGARAARRLGIVPIVLVATGGLAGCSGAAADTTSTPSPVSTAGPTAGPTAAAAAAAPTALQAGGELDSSCGDELGDSDGSDLAGVELVRSGDVLVVAFALTSPPVSGESFLTVELHDSSGAAVRQLGIELDGAEPVAAYIASAPSDPVQRLDDTVHVVDAAVHAAFPATVLDDLGEPWGWLASIGTESAVEDVCADGGTTAAPVPVVVG